MHHGKSRQKSNDTAKTQCVSNAATSRRPLAPRDRLNFRIDARIKQRAEDAASLLGQDLSTFAENALDEKARAVIEREERIGLSERDFALFMEAIDNPKPIGACLKAATQGYKTVRREHSELNW